MTDAEMLKRSYISPTLESAKGKTEEKRRRKKRQEVGGSRMGMDQTESPECCM